METQTIHAMVYNLPVKRNEPLLLKTTWMDLLLMYLVKWKKLGGWYEGKLWDDGIVLYLDRGGGYIDSICLSSQYFVFYYMEIDKRK